MRYIYGMMPVLEALKAADRGIERLILVSGAGSERTRRILEAARAAGVPVSRQPRAALDRLSGGGNHQGVVAIASSREYLDEDDLIATIKPDSLLILLDGVEDPHNLGAIIRTAECAGASAVVIPKRRSAGLTETVSRTSAGAIEYVPVARAGNLVALIERLKRKGVWIVGVDQHARTPYHQHDFTGATAIVLGGEGSGLHRLVREKCDAVVSIPMRGHISSLNVSVAAGVVLFEALRKRESGKTRE